VFLIEEEKFSALCHLSSCVAVTQFQ